MPHACWLLVPGPDINLPALTPHDDQGLQCSAGSAGWAEVTTKLQHRKNTSRIIQLTLFIYSFRSVSSGLGLSNVSIWNFWLNTNTKISFLGKYTKYLIAVDKQTGVGSESKRRIAKRTNGRALWCERWLPPVELSSRGQIWTLQTQFSR